MGRGQSLKKGAVVLCSGGLDSTVVMAMAMSESGKVIALTFDYGQRHSRELLAAKAVASHYGVEQITVRINADAWGGSALTDSELEIPQAREIDSSIPVTYVPARNLIFLSVALGVAEARNADAVYIGVNALDYSGYPDCRPEFIASFQESARLGLKRAVEGNPIEIKAPLISMSKAEIIMAALEIGAPIALTWSCYQGGITPCGSCDACLLRQRGFDTAGVVDPAIERG